MVKPIRSKVLGAVAALVVFAVWSPASVAMADEPGEIVEMVSAGGRLLVQSTSDIHSSEVLVEYVDRARVRLAEVASDKILDAVVTLKTPMEWTEVEGLVSNPSTCVSVFARTGDADENEIPFDPSEISSEYLASAEIIAFRVRKRADDMIMLANTPGVLVVDPGVPDLLGSDGIMVVTSHLFAEWSLYSATTGLPGGQVDLPEVNAVQLVSGNPVSGPAQLRLALANQADVVLRVYSVMGSLVAEEKHGVLAAGNHQLEWGPGNLSNGVYFINVVLDSKSTQLLKIVYIR